jgi:NTP pyrophosphatase (non-canonical NTP hydrolase)
VTIEDGRALREPALVASLPEPASGLGPSGDDPARGAFAFGDDIWPGMAKLNEECGEVIQVIGKFMMTHGNAAHWDGDLRKKLVEELGDLLAAIGFVAKYGLTEDEERAIQSRVDLKWIKFEAWHEDFDADPPPPLSDSDGSPEGGDACGSVHDSAGPQDIARTDATDA